MHRNTNRTRLIGDRTGNRLANPPGRIRTEFVTFFIIEFIDGFDQAEVTFLHQIQKLHAAADVAFRNADDQTQIGIRQILLGKMRVR